MERPRQPKQGSPLPTSQHKISLPMTKIMTISLLFIVLSMAAFQLPHHRRPNSVPNIACNDYLAALKMPAYSELSVAREEVEAVKERMRGVHEVAVLEQEAMELLSTGFNQVDGVREGSDAEEVMFRGWKEVRSRYRDVYGRLCEKIEEVMGTRNHLASSVTEMMEMLSEELMAARIEVVEKVHQVEMLDQLTCS